VHPAVITDIGSTTRKWRIQFQAPPAVGKYAFQLNVKSDSYVGTDWVQDVELVLEDASKLEQKVVEEMIRESKIPCPIFYILLGCADGNR
jgi:translocation protein SEC63